MNPLPHGLDREEGPPDEWGGFVRKTEERTPNKGGAKNIAAKFFLRAILTSLVGGQKNRGGQDLNLKTSMQGIKNGSKALP